jgi:hypothetical protein
VSLSIKSTREGDIAQILKQSWWIREEVN